MGGDRAAGGDGGELEGSGSEGEVPVEEDAGENRGGGGSPYYGRVQGARSESRIRSAPSALSSVLRQVGF